MMNAIARLRSAAQKRAAYYRTVSEIEAMPLEVAIDLDIYKPHAHRIARDAIYGH